MLRVRLLGGLALEADDGPLDAPASRPARELLAWLALHPGAHARLELARRFWPDVLETSARASLRTALHDLRRALGDDAAHLAVDRERVGLGRRLGRPARAATGRGARAAGEPLPGIDRDWALAARDEHRERVADAARRPVRRGRAPKTRVRWARELVRPTRCPRTAARRLMRCWPTPATGRRRWPPTCAWRTGCERELLVAPSRADARLLAGRSAPARAAARTRAAVRAALTARGPARRPRRGAAAACGRDAPGRRWRSPASRGSARRGCSPRRPDRPRARRDRRYGRCYEESVAPYEPFVEALGASAFARWSTAGRALAAVRGDRGAARGRGAAARRPALGRRRARCGCSRTCSAARTRRVVLGAYRDTRDLAHASAGRRRWPTCAATA